jgi:hypothetical protein
MSFVAATRFLIAVSASAAACACTRPEPATAQQLRARAAFELGCAPEALVLVRIDESTGGVAGCGRRVVYVESCREGRSCRWTYDREAPPPATGGWSQPPSVATSPPRPSPYPGPSAPRQSPYPEAEAESQWRERVPRLIRDDPGF